MADGGFALPNSLPGYGSGVDAAMPTTLPGAQASASAASSSDDYVSTEADSGQLNSTNQATLAFSTGMLEHARTVIGQQPESQRVTGPSVLYAPEHMDVSQYTLSQEHETRVKAVTSKVMDSADTAWQGAGAPAAVGSASPAQYGSWLRQPDQALWTDPIGQVTVHDPEPDPLQGRQAQDKHTMWRPPPGMDVAPDPADAGERAFTALPW